MNPSFSEEILTVLYVLFRARTPLKSEHIVDCLQDTSIDYFTAHQILEHHVENKNIFCIEQNGGRIYALSPIGKNSIEQFYPMIRASMRKSIDAYLADNVKSMVESMDISSSYCFSYDDKYFVMLKCFDDNACILDITLTADNKETADAYVKGWKEKAPDIYKTIIEKLI